MKIIAVVVSFTLALAAAAAAFTIVNADGRMGMPAATRAAGQVVAYGADTVCKLGCWG
jgi:hypothetical protein